MVVALATLAALPYVGATAEEATPMLVGFHGAPGLVVGDVFLGARVDHVDGPLRFARVLAADAAGFAERARTDARVRYVEPDGELRGLFVPDDPHLASGLQYAPSRVQAFDAWDRTRGSTAVQICIVDSGVNLSHEDIGADRYLGGIDYVDDDATPQDGNGHGTYVSAIAIARTDNGKGIAGMAAASWRHARVLDDGGSGSLADGASAIRWCADQGAFVITASVGTPNPSTALRDAVEYAWAQGSVFVAASGNDGCSPCVDYPAVYERAIAVGCTGATDGICGLSSGGPEVDVVAPGELLVSAWKDGSYVQRTGTSAAAPHVAAALALLKAEGPHATNAQARAKLEATARDLGAPGVDEWYGRGLLQVADLLANTAPSVEISCDDEGTADAIVWCAVLARDPEGHAMDVTIGWGDGRTATGSVPNNATAQWGVFYPDAGSFLVTASVIDVTPEALSSSIVSDVVLVRPNEAPAAPTLSCAPVPSVVGRDVTCTLSAQDDSDNVRFEIDWGDGTSSIAPPGAWPPTGTNVTIHHPYFETGIHEVAARAFDDASPSLASPVSRFAVDVRACEVEVDGSLLLGAAGLEVDGVSSATYALPDDCAGLPYGAQSLALLADVDVCWHDAEKEIRCDTGAGNEFGTVPEGATRAVVRLHTGVDAEYRFWIPAP